jgi:hypothetical protein
MFIFIMVQSKVRLDRQHGRARKRISAEDLQTVSRYPIVKKLGGCRMDVQCAVLEVKKEVPFRR